MTIIVCMPKRPGGFYVRGSGEATCARCGQAVSVAPSTVQIIEANPTEEYEISCIPCAKAEITAEGVEFMPITDGQLAEIGAHLTTNSQQRTTSRSTQ